MQHYRKHLQHHMIHLQHYTKHVQHYTKRLQHYRKHVRHNTKHVQRYKTVPTVYQLSKQSKDCQTSKNDHWCTNRHMSTQSMPNTQSPKGCTTEACVQSTLSLNPNPLNLTLAFGIFQWPSVAFGSLR